MGVLLKNDAVCLLKTTRGGGFGGEGGGVDLETVNFLETKDLDISIISAVCPMVLQ